MQISEIPGQDGYFIDSNGQVYSQWNNRGIHGTVKGSMLKPLKASSTKNGHQYIRFGRNGEVELLHRLVYRIFVGEIPEGMFICHKDGNPKNNSVGNLYAGTQSENMQDMVKHDRCYLSKLNEAQVREILNLKGKMLVKDIAYLYGVNRHSITNIFRGKSWRHITNKEEKGA